MIHFCIWGVRCILEWLANWNPFIFVKGLNQYFYVIYYFFRQFFQFPAMYYSSIMAHYFWLQPSPDQFVSKWTVKLNDAKKKKKLRSTSRLFLRALSKSCWLEVAADTRLEWTFIWSWWIRSSATRATDTHTHTHTHANTHANTHTRGHEDTNTQSNKHNILWINHWIYIVFISLKNA